MNETIILQGITVDQLLQKIDKIVELKLEEILTKQLQKPKGYEYWSATEVCRFLKISKPTLHVWRKEGKVTAYRISNRVLFRSDEVEASLVRIKYR